MDRERMKYLFREILGVDVDEVVKKVVATIAVERAKQAQENTKDWKKYMESDGGLVILPARVTHLGRKSPPKP
jgi:ribosomal protein L12E/L44/L45/RPP1/RPP2